MKEKYSKKQLDILIKCLNTDGFTPAIVESLLSSENLVKTYQYLQELALEEDMSAEDSEIFDQFDNVMLEDFAIQIGKKDFPRIREVEDKEKRAILVGHILDHPEEYEEKITNDEALDLILSTENLDYIHKWIVLSQDMENKFGVDFTDRLRVAMDELEEKQMLEDIAEAKSENYHPQYGPDIPEEKGSLGYVPVTERRFEDFNGYYDEGFVYDQQLEDLPKGEDPLHFSEKEKNALMIYEGASPGGCAAGIDSNSYKTLNTVMFPGIENELTRVFDDHQMLNPTVIFQTKEMLDYYHNLHSTMYKFSYQQDKPQLVRRVDRTQSFDEITQKKELVSSFSTTLNYFPTEFSKKHITLVEAQVMPGAMCVDFEKVLGDEYQHYMEREVLIAMGSHVEIEQVVPRDELNEYEKSVKAIDGSNPDQKIVMKILPLPKAKEPTKEQIEQNEKDKQFVLNYGNRDRVATFIARMSNMGGLKVPKSRAKEILPQEEIEFYLKWKGALQNVVKFDLEKTRYEIDKQVEEYRKQHSTKSKAEQELDDFKREVHEKLAQEKQQEVNINEQGHSKFATPDFEGKEEQHDEMPSQEQTKIESTRIAKQMISEYKEKYGATSHSSTGKGTSKPQITTEELDGLTKTRKLSKINKAITTFKDSIGKIVSGQVPTKQPKGKKNPQNKDDDTVR